MLCGCCLRILLIFDVVLLAKADGTMGRVLGTWSLDACMVLLPAASQPPEMDSQTLPQALGLPNLYLLVSQQLLLPSPSSGGLEATAGVGRVRASCVCPREAPGKAQRWLSWPRLNSATYLTSFLPTAQPGS